MKPHGRAARRNRWLASEKSITRVDPQPNWSDQTACGSPFSGSGSARVIDSHQISRKRLPNSSVIAHEASKELALAHVGRQRAVQPRAKSQLGSRQMRPGALSREGRPRTEPAEKLGAPATCARKRRRHARKRNKRQMSRRRASGSGEAASGVQWQAARHGKEAGGAKGQAGAAKRQTACKGKRQGKASGVQRQAARQGKEAGGTKGKWGLGSGRGAGRAGG